MESTLILPKALQAGHGWLCIKVEWKKLNAISIVEYVRRWNPTKSEIDWHIFEGSQQKVHLGSYDFTHFPLKETAFGFLRMEDGLFILALLLKIGGRLKEVEIWCLFR